MSCRNAHQPEEHVKRSSDVLTGFHHSQLTMSNQILDVVISTFTRERMIYYISAGENALNPSTIPSSICSCFLPTARSNHIRSTDRVSNRPTKPPTRSLPRTDACSFFGSRQVLVVTSSGYSHRCKRRARISQIKHIGAIET
jgi:hypothetical protein